MYSPTLPGAVPFEELGRINTIYLAKSSPRCDPTLLWGTTLDTDALDAFVVDQRRETGLLVSTPHVLLRAVVASILEHPLVNRRVIRHRLYRYDGVHVTMPMLQTRSGEAEVIFVRNAHQMTIPDLARFVWSEARDVALRAAQREREDREASPFVRSWRKWSRKLRLHWIHKMCHLPFFLTNQFQQPSTWIGDMIGAENLNGANAFVNYLGFPGAPPMITYKPSALPTNAFSVSVTMGPTEPRPVVRDKTVVIRNQAPLFVRLDHRMVNGHQAANFINSLRNFLHNPSMLAGSAAAERRAA